MHFLALVSTLRDPATRSGRKEIKKPPSLRLTTMIMKLTSLSPVVMLKMYEILSKGRKHDIDNVTSPQQIVKLMGNSYNISSYDYHPFSRPRFNSDVILWIHLITYVHRVRT